MCMIVAFDLRVSSDQLGCLPWARYGAWYRDGVCKQANSSVNVTALFPFISFIKKQIIVISTLGRYLWYLWPDTFII